MHIQLGLLVVALVALLAFTTRGLSLPSLESARVRRQGASPLLSRRLLEFAYYVLLPVARLAVATKVSPNVSSWTCLTVGLSAGVAAACDAIPLAGGLLIVSAVFDMLDGMVARSRGIASEAGEILDAAVDRYTEFVFLAGLCLYYRQEWWALLLVLAALLGSMLVSYSQAKAEAIHADVPRAWMRRPERVVYLGGAAFLSPLVTGWLEGGSPKPLHVPLLVTLGLVAILTNTAAIRRFTLLYALAKTRRPGDH
jgi:CDP-diacylglycerol--glycerol-3-phosphate 3-phosphatidyltransferase